MIHATFCGDLVTKPNGQLATFETIEVAIKELRAFFARVGSDLANVDLYRDGQWVASLC